MVDLGTLIGATAFLWSPLTFAILVSLATGLIWLAFAPSWSTRLVRQRLDEYLRRDDVIEEDEMRRPFVSRVVIPLLHRLLRALGTLAPKRNMEVIQQMLLEAGEPWGLTALDFLGLRLLAAVLLGGGYFFLIGPTLAFPLALRNALIMGGLGFFVPLLWLRSRAKSRQREIIRALPDALDMLTISVEAGLAFESALLRVGERWNNALTREFRRAVAEMRVGTPRDVALQRMAERTGVQDLRTFVAILIQSNQLGVSIAQVLHSQAAQMRTRRRQRAEELARQASVKMVFPLVFLIFPALFAVILGPVIPTAMFWLKRLGGG
ncbi:MAG TPA: type II secretion system F family protein [Caldilineae bacterium]|nr:type II secretion system F family protein [Caldilineae bacterium]